MRRDEIDLRSDVLTRPTTAMWNAMQEATPRWAPAGQDPTVQELEALAAKLTGKEAALFVPTTTTMANLVALMTHTRRGDQIVLEASSHILWSEESAFAHICGLAPRVIPSESGSMPPDEVVAALSEHQFSHRPTTTLICVENTHNAAGGTIVTPEHMKALATVAQEHGIPIHLDGARVLNASVALEQDLKTVVADVDTVALSLCKGLSAPVGALLCGPADFIERCLPNLRRLGGGSVHQAGMLAAAGIVALETMIPQLSHDNRRAKALGDEITGLNHDAIRTRRVDTNIVIVSVDACLMPARELLSRLDEQGIKAMLRSDDTIRFVTHCHIHDDDVGRVAEAVATIVRRS
jgi:threonine aldolase